MGERRPCLDTAVRIAGAPSGPSFLRQVGMQFGPWRARRRPDDELCWEHGADRDGPSGKDVEQEPPGGLAQLEGGRPDGGERRIGVAGEGDVVEAHHRRRRRARAGRPRAAPRRRRTRRRRCPRTRRWAAASAAWRIRRMAAWPLAASKSPSAVRVGSTARPAPRARRGSRRGAGPPRYRRPGRWSRTRCRDGRGRPGARPRRGRPRGCRCPRSARATRRGCPGGPSGSPRARASPARRRRSGDR